MNKLLCVLLGVCLSGPVFAKDKPEPSKQEKPEKKPEKKPAEKKPNKEDKLPPDCPGDPDRPCTHLPIG